ncbi:ankyrin repeat domain-containing protein [Endozoicomonas sp. ONNA2]|uniref:ankyrin repeat domain-containing protein n=1 Tax=Endozoicomonas sp. ONNA2 TaxID=2828741 RepID=UPI002147A0DE|nr:ankyrin repeat domain-containing protein [Endozoicomonas sp. ONNA2]
MNTPSSSSEPGGKQTPEALKVTERLNGSGFDLLDAASQGNLASAKALLEQGADIESRDQAGKTPLFRAVMSNNPDIVNFLLDAGASVHARDCDDLTPLHEARSQEIVKALLARGADIEAGDRFQATPLIYATTIDCLEAVKALLAEGANANARDDYHEQASLHIARSREVAEELLAKGADIEAWQVSGRTPLSIAAGSENLEVFNVLLAAGANIRARDLFRRTPLHRARTKEAVQALLERGADIEAKGDDKGTPLISVVSEMASPKAVKALLVAGANVHARNCLGRTPLHNAHSEEVVNELLVRGADIEARDGTGETPLFCAAYLADNPEALNALLAAGACVNARSDTGRTPLHGARSGAIVRELLARGADIEARNDEQETPLMCAILNTGNLEVTKAFLEAGANIEAADQFQQTPLHHAASNWRCDLRYMGLLLSEGANLEAREGITQRTPLHEAAISFSGKVSGKKVQLLVAEGANCRAQDWHRSTPLNLAIARIDNMKALLLATGRFDSIDRDDRPGNFQPQSLKSCARTSIRSRLVQHRQNTGKPLSKSVTELDLPKTLEEYLYEPLMKELIHQQRLYFPW